MPYSSSERSHHEGSIKLSILDHLHKVFQAVGGTQAHGVGAGDTHDLGHILLTQVADQEELYSLTLPLREPGNLLVEILQVPEAYLVAIWASDRIDAFSLKDGSERLQVPEK